MVTSHSPALQYPLSDKDKQFAPLYMVLYMNEALQLVLIQTTTKVLT